MRVGGRSFLLRLLFTHPGARAAQRDIVKPVEMDVPLRAPSARAAQRDIVKPVETDVPLHAPGCAGRAARYCQTGRDGCSSSRT